MGLIISKFKKKKENKKNTKPQEYKFGNRGSEHNETVNEQSLQQQFQGNL